MAVCYVSIDNCLQLYFGIGLRLEPLVSNYVLMISTCEGTVKVNVGVYYYYAVELQV